MILVADCPALIALASCDGLHLLDALFGTVIVPEAVYREAVVGDKPEAQQLQEYLQDKVRKIDSVGSVLLDGFSDLGETEAMLLYKQYSADKLLIDDKRGRRVAKINGSSMLFVELMQQSVAICRSGTGRARHGPPCRATLRFCPTYSVSSTRILEEPERFQRRWNRTPGRIGRRILTRRGKRRSGRISSRSWRCFFQPSTSGSTGPAGTSFSMRNCTRSPGMPVLAGATPTGW